jgi:uncharacterized protein YggU (UPF0235/DUF167 family)
MPSARRVHLLLKLTYLLHLRSGRRPYHFYLCGERREWCCSLPTQLTANLSEEPLKPSTATVIRVKVKPNSRTSAFEPAEGGTWLARLRSAPIDGKANAELIALVAAHFQCGKAAVSIKSGAAGRMKWVRIEAA